MARQSQHEKQETRAGDGSTYTWPRLVSDSELIDLLVESGARPTDAESTARAAVELDIEVFVSEKWYKVSARMRYGIPEAAPDFSRLRRGQTK